jgi:serine/threonine-protein kinase
MAESQTSPTPGPLSAGTVLQHRYAIERLLGGGGMGVVYLARDQRLANRLCAIKEMVDHFIDPAQRIEANEYFAREADTLAQLKHQAIPAITDRFDDQNRHYLVMEYVEGRNLEEEMAARLGPLPEGLVIDVVRQLCDVLAYLHSLAPPIIYRDMKPSNVMLTPKGRVVLIDFGIARLFKASSKGTMIGTLGFAPPEQYQGQVDTRSDIYSLGATMHCALTGRDPEKFPPFSFPPLRQLAPQISANLAGAIDAALAYDPDKRPATVGEFRDMMLYGRGLAHGGDASVTSRSGTADLSPVADDYVDLAPIRTRRLRSPLARVVGLVTFSLFLAAVAFGATYIYSDPELQARLGIKELVDNLPWKHEEILANARSHPLDFERLTLALSTRDGTAISPPQASFTDADLTNARYLKWSASFKNLMAGLEGGNQKVEAKFFDPGGAQIASSSSEQFVGPAQPTVDFSGVALMPTITDRVPGSYKVSIYRDGNVLTEQAFAVSRDTRAHVAPASADSSATSAASARSDEERRLEDDRRLAMIEARRLKPLEVHAISFRNTTKTGAALSGPTNTFDALKVLFVGWEVSFDNRLYKLEPGQYNVDANYVGPDGSTLGAVNDFQNVSPNQKSVTFSGRVGNSSGRAFAPGTYTVNFYLNRQFFAAKKFQVTADTSVASGGPSGRGSISGEPSGGSILTPTMATGSINGLPGGGSPNLELRLRPQPNGFLHGEMVIHKSGYGLTPIEGFVRGDHLQFQVPYGTETYYFEGQRMADQLSGTFEAAPSGARGTWVAQAN